MNLPVFTSRLLNQFPMATHSTPEWSSLMRAHIVVAEALRDRPDRAGNAKTGRWPDPACSGPTRCRPKDCPNDLRRWRNHIAAQAAGVLGIVPVVREGPFAGSRRSSPALVPIHSIPLRS